MRRTRLRLESLDGRVVPAAGPGDPPGGGGGGQSPVDGDTQQYLAGQDEHGNDLYITSTAEGDVWLSVVGDGGDAGTDRLLSENAAAPPAGPQGSPSFVPVPGRPTRFWEPGPGGSGGRWGSPWQPVPDANGGFVPVVLPPGWSGFESGGTTWIFPPPGGSGNAPRPAPSVPPPNPGGQPPTTPPPVQPTRPGAPSRPDRPTQPPIGGNVQAGPNGSVIRTDPDGTTTTWYPNGRIKREVLGATPGSPPTVIYWGPPGTPVVTQINPDGTTTTWFPDGEVRRTMPDGTVWTYPADPNKPVTGVNPRL